MTNPADNSPITRHAPIDRAFHWVTAGCVLVLLATVYLPPHAAAAWRALLHVGVGIVLIAAVAFHVVRALFLQRQHGMARFMTIGARDLRDARAGRLAGKYTLGQKLMHAALGTAVLVLVVTGALLLVKFVAPSWSGNPDLLPARAWAAIVTCHAVASISCLALTVLHVVLALLPGRRAHLRAMLHGQMTRAEAARFHDPARWAGNRRDDPHS